MKSAPSPAAVSALKKVQKQFKHWRKTKTGRERIPDSLWQAAADVFHIGGHSLNKVAKALHLNHTHLNFLGSLRTDKRKQILPFSHSRR
ncbi:hypothetical protein HRM2_p00060 (plasmid) [Desulforapulum autotrophicum HRM2]|uniref:Uncharacterized protein n=1 Tax=Desulforapulum autotrophicum (strain ATCC 43914 / DSM 3382 / VKM B-1955 / HRM2) TaxID=177437 RepID=C0QMK6_DESAH|nr:hypothetical protein [Desulforapulum autotrophicum]ACN18000.1 hypothetical protein HRM2_p00060 [Desulforapulum autotrophicum HRM2]